MVVYAAAQRIKWVDDFSRSRKGGWVQDRALQRSTAEVLSAIYEQDFSSFWGRSKLGAHHALATLVDAIAGGDSIVIEPVIRAAQ
jgi:hypothetical protein